MSMFRTPAGPYDDAVNKATDETLTSEDWGAIMEICDRVNANPNNGPKECVASLIKRLAHRNANVQLYTLELANALSKNCDKNMHRELASRAFTEALLKLANDRNTHAQVKSKIAERMKEWSDDFKDDTTLGIMEEAYHRLKQANPTLEPPSAPQKNQLTDLDRQKEEEELQLALALSLQEEERKRKASQSAPAASTSSSAPAPSTSTASGQQATLQSAPQPVPSGTTAATVSRVRALYDFVPSEPGELEFKKGDVIAVLESVYKDWWRGSLRGKTGIFPLNYVEKLTDPTPEELQREAQMEAEVFAEIKNVEKLLALLSASSTGPREEDNEEISKLYHQTLAIRPKLIKLIEKYSQKKDDFTQLNEKFIKARRDYEALLESSMAHPPQPTYHQYAMRPPVPQGSPQGVSQAVPQGYPPAGGPTYGAPTPQPEPHRFYTPAPPQEPTQYPVTSPPSTFQRPTATPAPVYFAGTEVPAQPAQPPPQVPQAQPLQPQYAPRPQEQRIPSGKQPAPLQTSQSPPPANAPFTGYQSPQVAQPPGNGYNNGPQELSTSVYDSPIATTSTSNPYSSAYPPAARADDSEDPYGAANPTTNNSNPSAPSVPAPSPPTQSRSDFSPHIQQPSYGQQGPYAPYYTQQHNPAGAAGAPSSASPYDARQTLPSRLGGGGPPPPQAVGLGVGLEGQRPQQPQYKAYVPPAASAPPADQGNGASGMEGYYRAAA